MGLNNLMFLSLTKRMLSSLSCDSDHEMNSVLQIEICIEKLIMSLLFQIKSF